MVFKVTDIQQNGENCINPLAFKGLVSQIFQQLKKHNKKHHPSMQLGNGQRTLRELPPMKKCKWPTNT